MALFQTAQAGSGVISPLWPNLTLSYSYDGYGLVFRDDSLNFLLVWNGDSTDQGGGPVNQQGRTIQYTQGQFTPWIAKFGGVLLNPGPKQATFRTWPSGLAYEFELDRHPTDRSPRPFPTTYTSGNTKFSRDTNYDTNNTGDGRRHAVWPPFRAVRFSSDVNLVASAWQASIEWNLTQLARPFAHVGAALQGGVGVTVPFTPFTNVKEYTSGFQLNWLTGSDGNLIPQAWDNENKKRLANDLDGVAQNWNASDPAHNDVTPMFALAAMGHPLGAVLLWMIYSWYVQGMPPQANLGFGAYAYPFGQERSVAWCALTWLYSYLVGFQWADPNLIRDWCGGLKPNHNNGGAGWRPRDAVRWWMDYYAGPDYGGVTDPARSRHDYWGSPPTKEFGPHLPIMASGTTYSFNGKNYGRQVGGLRGFHRYMTLWALPETIRAHDYVQRLDSSEFLIDPSRIASVRTFVRQHTQVTLDAGLIDF